MSGSANLKQRNSTAWAVLSALIPFALLYWFHKTNRQINFLNQTRGNDRRILNPWWLTGPTLVMVVLAGAFMISWLSSRPDVSSIVDESTDSSLVDGLESIRPARGLFDALYPVGDDDLDGEKLVESITQSAWTAWLLVAMIVVGLVSAAVYIVYLLQHIEAVVALGGTKQDKTLMVLMAILSLVSIAYLVLFVVYKSQEIVNDAVSSPSPAKSRSASKSGGRPRGGPQVTGLLE